jgi:hypothetical protein
MIPFRLLGYWYRLLYLLPVMGEWLVRGINKMIAYMIFYSPFGPRRSDSIQELRKEFDRAIGTAGIVLEVIHQDDEKFQFVLDRCPYGFCRSEHLGVCDAAMDMDRTMFGLAGGKLVVDECIPGGSPQCHISMYMMSAK